MSQYNGNQDIKVVRRYFVGTTTLRKGQLLAYQEDASTSASTAPNLRLGTAVEALNTSNAAYIAGVVPDYEAGKVGPCYVELLVPEPGDVLQVEADGSQDIAAGDAIEPDGTLGGLIKGTAAAGDYLFKALEAYTTDAKLSAIWVYKL